MCNPISWWYVRANGVGTLYISETTDSHTKIAAEFGIRDNGMGEVCAGEFRPDANKPSPDPKTWPIVWDYQGKSRRPAWMDDEAEASLRKDLERRCAAYVYTTGEHKVQSCRAFVFGDASVTLTDSSRAELWDSSRAVLRDSSSAELRDSSSAELWGSSRAELWDSSSAELWDSSRAVLRDSSSAELRDFSSAELRGSSRAVLRSKYADILGRAEYDGIGCKPLRIAIKVGKTYGVVRGKLIEIKVKAKAKTKKVSR